MKTILFLPSNDHHVKIFHGISEILKKDFRILFLTQGSFKNEGAEEELAKTGTSFRKIDEYEKAEPKFILKSEDVSLVVIGNDTDVIPQWFVNQCNDYDIPSVLIQDGIQFDFTRHNTKFSDVVSRKDSSSKLQKLALKLWLTKKYKKISYGMGNCTQIHVWGDSQKKYFVKKGVDESKIFTTGYFLLDKIKTDSSDSRTILYAPSDLVFSKILNQKDMKSIASTLYSVVSPMKDVNLVVRPHPREDRGLFEDASKSANIALSDSNFFDLVGKSSVVISDISSTVLEALLYKKQVIIFLPQIHDIVNDDSFPLDLVKLHAVHFAGDKKQLSDTITSLLEKKNDPVEHLSVFLGPMDGQESSRSAKLIAQLIDG